MIYVIQYNTMFSKIQYKIMYEKVLVLYNITITFQ